MKWGRFAVLLVSDLIILVRNCNALPSRSADKHVSWFCWLTL